MATMNTANMNRRTHICEDVLGLVYDEFMYECVYLYVLYLEKYKYSFSSKGFI